MTAKDYLKDKNIDLRNELLSYKLKGKVELIMEQYAKEFAQNQVNKLGLQNVSSSLCNLCNKVLKECKCTDEDFFGDKENLLK